MLVVCCDCKKIRYGNEWTEHRFESSDGPVSHTYCPDCFDDGMAEVNRLGEEIEKEKGN